MWRMLQVDTPDDYVLATGVGYTIKDFLEASFGHVGLEWQKYVKFDERYLRPTEVDALIGDSTKAQQELGWVPTIDGAALAKIMVDADVKALEHEGRPWIDQVSLDSWKIAA
jgi:GDPmannose 4,6-dehydratase